MNYHEIPEMIQRLMDIGDRRRMLRFGVHSGVFNPDELLATAVLMEELPQYQIDIVRTRNKKLLEKCDLVYDVGGGIYDHHGDAVLYPNGIKMASCGKILNDAINDHTLKEELRRQLFYTVEAQDNGQSGTQWKLGSNKLAFVSSFVPSWDEDQSGEAMDKAFWNALDLVRTIYRRELTRARSMIAARSEAAHGDRLFDGKILSLKRYCPWADVAANDPKIRACIYPDLDGHWRIHIAHAETGTYDLKYHFPEEWWGKHSDELADLTGYIDAIFCHSTSFLMAVGSKDTAVAMAKYIADLPEYQKEK